ncbi:hypothetical protein P280DRAFT_471090 [Massarina eburnea CBS 473.64]|uniref:Mediator of RNA polymerase II transcription subunit 22 n=1 Tax=Massarina eburnea CBS 473.64 TaxID=1395130 RepID=A0A6A6RTQ6_9PLEO|nr:hypothetical protein P280DRAFT_471090 [Massarina eburnea CBS 473.64]
MDPKQRNAAALRKRVQEIVASFIQKYQSVLQHAKEDEDSDYSRTAQKELLIKEDAMAIVTTAQNTAILIRDLQELWLFGSLDTLADPADEEVDNAKALEVAGLIEKLAKQVPKAHDGAPNSEAAGVENGES